MRDGRAGLDRRLHRLPDLRPAALPLLAARRGTQVDRGSAVARDAARGRARHQRAATPLYTLRWNPRRFYPLVDDKLATKRLCEAQGIPVPRLLAAAHHHFELRRLLDELERWSSFVLKPARGAMGNGIVVVLGRATAGFVRSGGREMSRDGFVYHAAGIISGLYSLAGHSDVGDGRGAARRRTPRSPALCTRRRARRARHRLPRHPGDVHDAAPDAALGGPREPPPGRDRRGHRPRDRRHAPRDPARPPDRREPRQRRLGARRADPGLRPRARDRGARRPTRPGSATWARTWWWTRARAR